MGFPAGKILAIIGGHFSCINDVGNMREHKYRIMTFAMFCYDSARM
jgi:hypothetical protein